VSEYPKAVPCALCAASGKVYVTYDLVCYELCGGETEFREEPRYEAYDPVADNPPSTLQEEPELCPTCQGEGVINGRRKTITCPACEGRGTRVIKHPPSVEACPRCEGEGHKQVASLRGERRFLGLDVATGLSPEEAQSLRQREQARTERIGCAALCLVALAILALAITKVIPFWLAIACVVLAMPVVGLLTNAIRGRVVP
jgi:RecJ-like exonuclease